MADDIGAAAYGAFWLLGRVWSRLIWSILFLTAVLWDVFSLESAVPIDALHAFGAGVATGLTFAGLLFAMRHAHDAPRAPGEAGLR